MKVNYNGYIFETLELLIKNREGVRIIKDTYGNMICNGVIVKADLAFMNFIKNKEVLLTIIDRNISIIDL